MFAQIIVAILLGMTAGTLTGLIPGVHVNLISAICISLSVVLPISPLIYGAFILSLALTHTFIDSIPSIYLGAPDESMALVALPGHRLLLKGKGHQAIVLTVIGSFLGLLLGILCIPLLLKLFPLLYEYIQKYIGYILFTIILILIIKGTRPLESFTMFLLSGILGIICLNIQTENVLLPLLSGLFGISMLLISLDNNLPEQSYKTKKYSRKLIARTIPPGVGVAAVASFLPGFGSSQSALVAQSFVGNIGDEGFLLLTGTINTVNMALSLVTYYTLEKARNGAIVALTEIIGTIQLTYLIIYTCLFLIVGGTAVQLACFLSRQFSRLITKINYKKLIIAIISFIIILVIIMSGVIGFIILITATAVGILATNLKVGKNNLLGCLIIPVLFFFLL
jgi:putative membrane protein